MNLKNSIQTNKEMLNTVELSNTEHFNHQVAISQSNPQWTPQSTASNKHFLNNLQTIYNDVPENNTFAYNLSNQSRLDLPSTHSIQSNSNFFTTNPNLINLNQETTNLQLIDQSKTVSSSPISSNHHYYNHHHLHNQSTILNNSLVNNSNNVYDFTNDLSNGSKSYLDQQNVHQHVVNTTNNFHHYNISLHHPNSNSLHTESSINLHHLQLENNLSDQNQNNLLNSNNIQLNTKKRKKDTITSNLNKESNKSNLKNITIKKELNNQLIQPNQIKEEINKQTPLNLNKSLNQPIDNYSSNYDFFTENNSVEANTSYSAAFLESVFQSIKFYPFQQTSWFNIYDENFNKLTRPQFEVYADKGFNFSNIDDVFVCQKKNHFQITVHIHPIKLDQTKLSKFNNNVINDKQQLYIRLKSDDGTFKFKKITEFVLTFYGVKMESPNQRIKIEQSQSDRSKKPFLPIRVNFLNGQICKNTIGRLHFAETTAGNMRKKGKPNPDQKFFYLVAALCAIVDNKEYTIVSHASERIIVRASNPGQFETSDESCWNRSQFVNDAIYHNGKVGINIDDPDESLVVCGNLKVTGNFFQPSDERIKENIKPIDTNSSLLNISNLRLYSFNYNKSYCDKYLKDLNNRKEVGVLAQELIRIIPDAVETNGDIKLNENELIDNFLVVNKNRIFFETVAAVQELNTKYQQLKGQIEKYSLIFILLLFLSIGYLEFLQVN